MGLTEPVSALRALVLALVLLPAVLAPAASAGPVVDRCILDYTVCIREETRDTNCGSQPDVARTYVAAYTYARLEGYERCQQGVRESGFHVTTLVVHAGWSYRNWPASCDIFVAGPTGPLATVPCPQGEPPPNPGWGHLLP